MKRSAHVFFQRSTLSALIGIGIVPHAAHAEPLALVQYPAGTMARRPAPNVVLTLDDSGSMAGDRMTALKDALAESFKAANVPDGSIRLGWNGLNRCRQFTRNSDGNCQGQNRLRVLDATQRGNFLRWVRDDLEADGGTPTHAAYQAVGEYFKTAYTDLQSPWAARPGTAGGTALSCRRAYSLVMTDGGWNHRDDVSAGGGNADGTSRTLGDGSTVY
ncbi:MAG: VWA domain-containing protein, partial [Comamonadaceae bacterium]